MKIRPLNSVRLQNLGTVNASGTGSQAPVSNFSGASNRSSGNSAIGFVDFGDSVAVNGVLYSPDMSTVLGVLDDETLDSAMIMAAEDACAYCSNNSVTSAALSYLHLWIGGTKPYQVNGETYFPLTRYGCTVALTKVPPFPVKVSRKQFLRSGSLYAAYNSIGAASYALGYPALVRTAANGDYEIFRSSGQYQYGAFQCIVADGKTAAPKQLVYGSSYQGAGSAGAVVSKILRMNGLDIIFNLMDGSSNSTSINTGTELAASTVVNVLAKSMLGKSYATAVKSFPIGSYSAAGALPNGAPGSRVAIPNSSYCYRPTWDVVKYDEARAYYIPLFTGNNNVPNASAQYMNDDHRKPQLLTFVNDPAADVDAFTANSFGAKMCSGDFSALIGQTRMNPTTGSDLVLRGFVFQSGADKYLLSVNYSISPSTSHVQAYGSRAIIWKIDPTAPENLTFVSMLDLPRTYAVMLVGTKLYTMIDGGINTYSVANGQVVATEQYEVSANMMFRTSAGNIIAIDDIGSRAYNLTAATVKTLNVRFLEQSVTLSGQNVTATLLADVLDSNGQRLAEEIELNVFGAKFAQDATRIKVTTKTDQSLSIPVTVTESGAVSVIPRFVV